LPSPTRSSTSSNAIQFRAVSHRAERETAEHRAGIWARSKSDIKPEEYNEFYQFVGHDHDDRCTAAFHADAPLAIQALLFVPARNIESLGMARTESEIHLYCRKC